MVLDGLVLEGDQFPPKLIWSLHDKILMLLNYMPGYHVVKLSCRNDDDLMMCEFLVV